MTKKLDRSRPHGTIMHGDISGHDPKDLPAFVQDGHYFKPDGSFHSTDGKLVKKAETDAATAAATAPVNTLPAVDPADVDELLKDPRSEGLLALPRDELVKLVKAANGPVVAGDDSQRLMVAWVIANTQPQAPSSGEL